MAAALESDRLAGLVEEAYQITDDRPRSICPDCGDGLAPGEIICARSWARLSGAERQLMGRNLVARVRR